MERDEILALYDWSEGTCFRHPAKGPVDTTVVKRLRPRADGEHEVRACRDCVVAMEDIRREEAARSGGEYVPGRAGETLEQGEQAGPDSSGGWISGENLGSGDRWGADGER